MYITIPAEMNKAELERLIDYRIEARERQIRQCRVDESDTKRVFERIRGSSETLERLIVHQVSPKTTSQRTVSDQASVVTETMNRPSLHTLNRFNRPRRHSQNSSLCNLGLIYATGVFWQRYIC